MDNTNNPNNTVLNTHECEICGYETDPDTCTIRCDNCGFYVDCSDPK